MAMHPKCVLNVEAAIGRPLTEGEKSRIYDGVAKAKAVVARGDRAAWRGMSDEDRYNAAAKLILDNESETAAQQAIAKALGQRKRRSWFDRVRENAKLSEAEGGSLNKKWGEVGSHNRALIKLLKGADVQIQATVNAAYHTLTGALDDVVSQHVIPLFGEVGHDETVVAALRVMKGETINHQGATALGNALTNVFEGLRQRLYDAGAMIGKLPNYLPQHHDTALITRAGMNQWVDDTVAALDRNMYVNTDTGELMSDTELRNAMVEAYQTFATEGRNGLAIDELAAKVEQGFSNGSITGKNSNKHREIFFKNLDTWAAYHAKYSPLKPGAIVMQALDDQARAVGRVEQFGPNPVDNFTSIKGMADLADDEIALAKGLKDTNAGRGVLWSGADHIFKQIIHNEQDMSERANRVTQWLSSYHAATKLGRTAVRSVFQDIPGLVKHAMATGQGKQILPLLRSTLTGASRKEMRLAGIGVSALADAVKDGGMRLNSMASTLSNVANASGIKAKAGALFDQDTYLGVNGMTRAAQATMKYTGLKAWTDGIKRAGEMVNAGHLGESLATDWDKLDPMDKNLFTECGILAEDWAELQQHVKTMDLNGVKIPDVNAIDPARFDLHSKVMGYIYEGGMKTSPERDVIAKTVGSFNSTGSLAAAVIGQISMFRGSGYVMTANMLRHWKYGSTMGRVGMIAGYLPMTVAAGYMAQSVVNLTNGQDVLPMTGDTLLSSLLVGGGLAVFADLANMGMDAVNNRGGASNAFRIMGPTASDIGSLLNIGHDVLNLTDPNKQNAGGKFGTDLARLARNQIPFTNWWYARAAVDHLLMANAAEAMNPGYKQRIEQYAKDSGADYWAHYNGAWEAPGVGSPQK